MANHFRWLSFQNITENSSCTTVKDQHTLEFMAPYCTRSLAYPTLPLPHPVSFAWYEPKVETWYMFCKEMFTAVLWSYQKIRIYWLKRYVGLYMFKKLVSAYTSIWNWGRLTRIKAKGQWLTSVMTSLWRHKNWRMTKPTLWLQQNRIFWINSTLNN